MCSPRVGWLRSNESRLYESKLPGSFSQEIMPHRTPSQSSIRPLARPSVVRHSPVGWGSAAAAKPGSKNVAAQIAGIERMMFLGQFAIQLIRTGSFTDRFRRHFDNRRIAEVGGKPLSHRPHLIYACDS